MIELLTHFLTRFLEVMSSGGMVTWSLFILNLVLWYVLGYRYLILQRGSRANVRRLIYKHRKKGKKQKIRGLLDAAVIDALDAKKEARQGKLNCRNFIRDALSPFYCEVKKHAVLVKTIVIIAPLIGLLGTVIGMIETFDALQTMAMFSQGNSIAGGISKAMFTTEMGLVVAVPGLLLGRILDRKEAQFEMEFQQLTDILCTRIK